MLHSLGENYLIYDDTIGKIWYGDPFYFDDASFTEPLAKLNEMETSIDVDGKNVSLVWDIATVAEFETLNFGEFKTRRLFRPKNSKYEREAISSHLNRQNSYIYHIWGQCVRSIKDKGSTHMICEAKILVFTQPATQYEVLDCSEPNYTTKPQNIPHSLFAIATYTTEGDLTTPSSPTNLTII